MSKSNLAIIKKAHFEKTNTAEFKLFDFLSIFKNKQKSKVSLENQKRGFILAKYMKLVLLRDIFNILAKAKESGKSYNDVKKEMKDRMVEKGWLENEKKVASRVDLIVENTISVNSARKRLDLQLANKKFFPYLRWVQKDRNNQRDDHKALHGLIFSKDDADIYAIAPPKGFRCGCRLQDVSEKEFQSLGGKISTVKSSLSLLNESSKEFDGINWKPDKKDFPKEMQDLVEKVI